MKQYFCLKRNQYMFTASLDQVYNHDYDLSTEIHNQATQKETVVMDSLDLECFDGWHNSFFLHIPIIRRTEHANN